MVSAVHDDVSDAWHRVNLLRVYVFEVLASHQHADVPETNDMGQKLCHDA